MNEDAAQRIGARLASLRERISLACERAGRAADEVELVAISKTVDAATIRAAFAAGVRIFGENRAQELREKSRALSDLPIEWHFVGTIQTNKIRYVTPTAALVHSVDRAVVAQRISERAAGGPPQRILVQVNTSGEESKSGVAPSELPALLDQLVGLPNLVVAGLMTIGPLTEDERAVGSAFRALARARDEARAAQRPGMPLEHLSMGMSGDFPLAIAEGATLIRVGTALFGSRR